jgi:hypothetical protein
MRTTVKQFVDHRGRQHGPRVGDRFRSTD